jgi:hypothetical protein
MVRYQIANSIVVVRGLGLRKNVSGLSVEIGSWP